MRTVISPFSEINLHLEDEFGVALLGFSRMGDLEFDLLNSI